jgi:hypothetical protein
MALIQRDFILRMIEAIAAAIARIRKRRESGDLVAARREVHNATVELLGSAAAMVGMLDSRTAANLVSDPTRIAMWARLLHEDAEILREMKRNAEGDAADRRVLELLLEAWQREKVFDEETQKLYAEVSARVPAASLDAGFRAISAELSASP